GGSLYREDARSLPHAGNAARRRAGLLTGRLRSLQTAFPSPEHAVHDAELGPALEPVLLPAPRKRTARDVRLPDARPADHRRRARRARLFDSKTRRGHLAEQSRAGGVDPLG